MMRRRSVVTLTPLPIAHSLSSLFRAGCTLTEPKISVNSWADASDREYAFSFTCFIRRTSRLRKNEQGGQSRIGIQRA